MQHLKSKHVQYKLTHMHTHTQGHTSVARTYNTVHHTHTHTLTHQHIRTHTQHMRAHTHKHTSTYVHTHNTPGHVFTVRMDVHLKPLVVVELLPDGCLVLWPEHGPRLGRSSVILLCIHHLSIVRKGPDGKRELSEEWA